jgi:hypothetical protein
MNRSHRQTSIISFKTLIDNGVTDQKPLFPGLIRMKKEFSLSFSGKMKTTGSSDDFPYGMKQGMRTIIDCLARKCQLQISKSLRNVSRELREDFARVGFMINKLQGSNSQAQYIACLLTHTDGGSSLRYVLCFRNEISCHLSAALIGIPSYRKTPMIVLSQNRLDKFAPSREGIIKL